MIAENIIGNTEVKEYLEKIVKSNNVLHSYLFLGTEGIGKKEIAKEFAKKILCDTKDDDCTCKSCVCFDSNNHPDLYIIDYENQSIKIEEIRKLTEKVIEKPIISNKKVYIINNAETMTKEAQNCLLKTLEEPPEFVTIILISSNENLILNTIKSRCMSIKFNNIDKELLKKYINDNLENKNFPDNLLEYINGSIGKAIKLQDTIDKYIEIDNFLKKITSLDIVDFLYYGKVVYDKENIQDILNYIIVCLYSNSKDNVKYMYCIDHINKCSVRLKSNSNFDMCIDNMLMGMWEEMNENCSRG